MKNTIKIQELQNIGAYTVLARIWDDGTVHEYAAVFGYDRYSKTWSSGNYFKSLESAVDFARRKGKMSFDRLEEIATYMLNEYGEYEELKYTELGMTEDEWHYFTDMDEDD